MHFFRRYSRAALRCTILAIGTAVTSTCSDSPFRPGQAVSASFDIEGLLAAAQSSLIPVDTVIIELRRVSDSSVAVSDTIDTETAGVTVDADSVVLEVVVPLQSDPEEFYLYLAVIGDGEVWYEVNATVSATAAEPTSTPVLTPSFVGPGADGTDLVLSPSDTTLTGGDSVLVTGTVYGGESVIAGAPVTFSSGDETLVAPPTQAGRNQAWVFAPAVLTDSVTLTATAPTAGEPITASGIVRFFARPDELVLVSGDEQSMDPGEAAAEPLVVQVVDAAGDPYARGYRVDFAVATGPTGTTVDPTTATTDAEGLAQTTLTAGDAAGAIQVSATAQDLTGSPVTFVASVAGVTGPATVAINDGDNQTATVGTAVPVPPSVLVTNALDAPVPDVQVTFAVTAGGGSVAGAVATTDAEGIARVGSWTLGQIAGANTLSATVGGLPSVTFTAVGTADAAATLVAISGDDQTAEAGTTLPAALVVEVRDQYDNPVVSELVVWSASEGSVSPTSGATDADGRTQTSWTLGSNSVTQTATATVTGVTPVVFTATATFQNPTVLLDLLGTDRIGLGSSADLGITLSSPAPVGGVTVTVTTDNPDIVGVQQPGSVFIAEGNTTGQIGLDGLSTGISTVRGNAPSHDEGTLIVEVSPLVMSLPSTLNVPFGATTSIPIQISTAAPVGGETVSLTSNDPTVVEVLTPTVTIPAGLQTANGTLSGTFPGTATVTATSVTYGTAQSIVSTTANLNIVESSASLNASFGTDITVRLESGGSPIAAPAPGATVTLTAGDPTCLSAETPITIPTGLVSANAALSYGGSATLPCTTTLAAAATDLIPDTINVSVQPAPAINISTTNVGSGLQRNWSGSLGATNHGGVNLVLTSSDPAVLLLSPDATTPGTASITLPIANGVSAFNYYTQGVEDATGAITVTATAAGFSDGTTTVDVVQPAVEVWYVDNTTTLSPDDPFQVFVGVPNANNSAMSSYLSVRAGAPAPLTATVVSSDPTVGQLVTSTQSGGSVTVDIVAGQQSSPSNVAAGGVAFDPLSGGSTTVSASIPGFAALPLAARDVTVSAPGINLSATVTGAGLQRPWSGSLGATEHGGVDVVLTSSNSEVLLLSPDATTPGTASITLPLANGAATFSFYVQGAEDAIGTATITATATGFTETSAAVDVLQPAVEVWYVDNTTTLSPDDPFQIFVGIPNANNTGMASYLSVRAGAPAPLTATVVSSDAAVGELVTSAQSGAAVTVDIVAGQQSSPSNVAAGGVAFDPLTGGSTTISASIPGFIALPLAAREITVSAPGINLSAATTGAGLQRSWSGSLGATQHGGVDVVLTSSNPQVLLLSPDAVTPGTASITLPVADGTTGFSFYVQGVEDASGTVSLSATATGFSDANTTVDVLQSAVEVWYVDNTTTLSPDDPFQVFVGIPNANNTGMASYLPVRAGAPGPLTATITSSNPGVGQLVTSAQAGGVVTVDIAVGQQSSPSNVAGGGVAFDPLTSGTTTVAVTIPGFTALPLSSRDITVTAPGINLSPTSTGSGLQRSWSGSLGATEHGGVNLVITSSNPQVLLLSPDPATPGSGSITLSMADGLSGFSYYVQGVEGATGTVTVTATADGFTDGTSTVDVLQPGVEIWYMATSTSVGAADDPFQVFVGIPNGNNTGMAAYLSVSAGTGPLTATVASSDPSVGQLVTSAQSGGNVTVEIAEGQQSSPTNVAAGGVAFDALTEGTTTVEARITNFIMLPLSTQLVTVNP